MQVAVIGAGYVGLVAAACLAEIGHTVTCVDNDAARIAALRRGQTVIHEEFLPVLFQRHLGRSLRFTTSLTEAVQYSTILFVAVGTPASESGDADLSLVEDVCCDIAQQVNQFHLIVVKSTVPAGTSRCLRRVLLRNGIGSQCFETASNPEFLREGTAVTDFLYPDRIVLGCDGSRGSDLLQELYRPLLDGRYAAQQDAIPAPDDARIPPRAVLCSSASAELIKQASNAFLAMKISFINAVANVCEGSHADIEEVVEGMGSDQRIGGKFLKPGIGYGGSCFPKDLLAFRAAARDSGYEFRLLDEVMQINECQRRAFVQKVRRVLRKLKGKRLGVLGLAYKEGTDDIRESPAIAVVRVLLEEGAEIVAYDPAASGKARDGFALSRNICFADSAYSAAQGADALLVLTDWEEFASLDLDRLRDQLKHPIVIDGRNLYSRKQMLRAGLSYYSVGRPAPVSEAVLTLRRAVPKADAA